VRSQDGSSGSNKHNDISENYETEEEEDEEEIPGQQYYSHRDTYSNTSDQGDDSDVQSQSTAYSKGN
jgi:hypothetical protein